MDPAERRNPLRDLRFPPPLPPPSPPQPPLTAIYPHTSSTGTSFPIIAVAVIGILATGFLLVSYYVFVIKCCLNWHRIDILRRFSLSRRRSNQDPLMVYSPELRNRGLDESVIRAIPIFKFKKRREEDDENDSVSRGGEEEKNSQECSVCLNEFQEEEKLRIIPNCYHLFHIDCIDIWLQNNANCPLCRTRVSCDTSFPPVQVSAPRTSPSNPISDSDTISVRGENDFVVIDLSLGNGNRSRSNQDSLRNERLLLQRESSNSSQIVTGNPLYSISPSPRKIFREGLQRKGKRFQKVTSMGDECIDIGRGKDEQFGGVQPIRRSISMDSSVDRQLYLAVQEAICRQNREAPVVGEGGGSSNSGNVSNRVKRSFFSFGSSRRSRSSSVLPLYFEP